jgi:hypothetical protein
MGHPGRSGLKERGDDGSPFRFKRAGEGWMAGAAVPVVGVEGVAFLAVEVRVNASAVGGVDVLGESVGGGPVAVGVVPEGLQERWEGGGLVPGS